MEEDPASIMKRFSNLLLAQRRNGNRGSLPPILHAAERAFEAAEAAEALARVEATYARVPGASFSPCSGDARSTAYHALAIGERRRSEAMQLLSPSRSTSSQATPRLAAEHTAVPSSASGQAGRGWGLSAPLLGAQSHASHAPWCSSRSCREMGLTRRGGWVGGVVAAHWIPAGPAAAGRHRA
jgi:hypothetical protein